MTEEYPLIQARNIYKSFHAGRGNLEVLKGIDLDVTSGEMLCITGASGVGKSTLLYALGTLDRPTKGSVLFDGVDVLRLPEKALAEFRNRNIGFIFQLYQLLPEFTVLENTAMPALIRGMSTHEAMSTAEEVLSEVELSERLDHKPGELSGGEQQRVAIARALVNKPRVVLADEPTGNLDGQTGEIIFNLLKKINLARGQTIIVVTHNDRLASKMDRVVHLVDGRVSRTEKGDCDV